VRRFIPLVLVLGLAIAACGGDDSPDTGDAATDWAISMVEFEFDPAEPTVPAGEEITLVLENAGSVEHNWVLLAADVRLEDEADLTDDMVLFEQAVDPGQSVTTTFTAAGRGIYQVICSIPGHFTAGMEGRLTVVDG
jgi:uncharacterized cupredoxin-like copper-binding protein